MDDYLPRACGYSEHVDDECCQPNEAGEVFDCFFVTGGDTAALFDAVEEAFDLIAIFVPRLVVAFSGFAIFARFDTGLCFELFDGLACFIPIVGGVTEDMRNLARWKFIQDFAAVRAIAVLSRTQVHFRQMSVRVHSGVNLGI